MNAQDRAESHAHCVFNFTQLLSAVAVAGLGGWQLHPCSAGTSYFLTPTAFDVFSFPDFIILGLHNASLLWPWFFFFSVLQGGQYGPVHLLLGHLFLATGGCPINFCLCFVQLSELGSVFLVYLGFIPLFPM